LNLAYQRAIQAPLKPGADATIDSRMTPASNEYTSRREIPLDYDGNDPEGPQGFQPPARPEVSGRQREWRSLDDPRLAEAYAAAPTAEVPQTAPAKPNRLGRATWELAQTIALAILIFLVVRAVAQNFRVEGPSMQPGLHNGQYLLVNKAVYFKLNLGTLDKFIPFIDAKDGGEQFLFHAPQRGDVIVFRYPKDPSRDFIKRVIGVPGDTVSISDGVVNVNGVALTEPYINGGARGDMAEQVVPQGSYFVLGDNRANSSDSRAWGYVPEENIIGKAMLSYWPLSELGGVGNTSLDLGFVKIPFF
jgi:signal peptidase I